MKYEYKTATGMIVVEVTDDWCEVLKELDREEQNNEHKETRRHSTLNNDIEDYILLSNIYRILKKLYLKTSMLTA